MNSTNPHPIFCTVVLIRFIQGKDEIFPSTLTQQWVIPAGLTVKQQNNWINEELSHYPRWEVADLSLI